MKSGHWQWIKRLPALLEIPAPDRAQLLQRIKVMERDMMLPLKFAAIIMLVQSFYFSPWTRNVLSALDIAVESTQFFFTVYVFANVAFAVVLLAMSRLPLALIQWSVFTISLVDGLFLASLTLVTGGYDSILYWLFPVLIVRNAVSVPPGMLQIILNLAISACYGLAGLVDAAIAGNLDEATRRVLEMTPPESIGEPLLLRLMVLWLTMLCCYGIQVLLEKQQLAAEEARESAVREGQLHSAGRLAAEFAHQIKNPLAIINNAVFSLQRALREKKTDPAKPLEIIAEEVARVDRIITQIMGYAELSEGRVEKLNVIEELDHAIQQVFPSALAGGIQIHRQYAKTCPPLLMQRRHLAETLVNLLQNAREALNGKGTVYLTADCQLDHSVEITIRDDGPGIPADKLERIFEAYFTTKERGTGLGLAIAKHNVELYGGTIGVESELGKGAKFTLFFPAKTLMKPSP